MLTNHSESIPQFHVLSVGELPQKISMQKSRESLTWLMEGITLESLL